MEDCRRDSLGHQRRHREAHDVRCGGTHRCGCVREPSADTGATRRGRGPGRAGTRADPKPTPVNFTPPPGAVELQYDAVGNLLKLPPDVYLGEAAGVAVNSKGHIFVYSRGGHTQLFEFDRDGKFLREIGKGLYGFDFAHVVRVDKDDNIWCVDEGANVVIKFNPEGRVLLVLGRKWETRGRTSAPAGAR